MSSPLYSISEPKSSRLRCTSPGCRPRILSMFSGAINAEGKDQRLHGTSNAFVDSRHIPMIHRASSTSSHDSNIYLYKASSCAKGDSPERGCTLRIISRRSIGLCRGDEMYLMTVAG